MRMARSAEKASAASFFPAVRDGKEVSATSVAAPDPTVEDVNI